MNPSKYLIEALRKRGVSSGGFSFFPGGSCRPDATAWAVIALRNAGAEGALINSGMDRLAKDQFANGAVPASSDAHEALWVTSLAVLAWQKSESHKECMKRAVEYLLKNQGKHWKKFISSPLSNDPSLKGWSWTSGAHSWVAPTSYCLMALSATKDRSHPSVQEAAKMLMDRQLDTGGWNYGNTFVYGTRLYPQPDQTGLALYSLRPYASPNDLSLSIAYLSGQIDRIVTPLSLGWALLGLRSWDHPVPTPTVRVSECLRRQDRLGEYNTQELSVLLLSLEGKIHV